jgi:hypothetical protein
MSDDDKAPDAVRDELIKQAIIFGFGVVTLILYTVGQRKMGEPDFLAELRCWLRMGRPAVRDPEAEALEQVQREISLLEHGES